jgi:hypothetical protein
MIAGNESAPHNETPPSIAPRKALLSVGMLTVASEKRRGQGAPFGVLDENNVDSRQGLAESETCAHAFRTVNLANATDCSDN